MRTNRQEGSWWLRLLRSRLMLSVNLLVLGFVGWSLAREFGQGRQVADQLNGLKKQIAELDQQNGQYDDVISKFNTPSYLEREARLKLGYQKPGEQVLIVKNAGDAGAASAAPAAVATEDRSSLSNPQKWWQYFFGHK